jgi:hypothetical protein
MQGVLNVVWDTVLPGLRLAGPLPEDQALTRKLQAKRKTLTLPLPSELASAKAPAGVAGKRFQFSPNEQKIDSLKLECDDAGNVTLVGGFSGRPEQRIPCGRHQWTKCRLAFGALPEQSAAAAGAWTGADTYTAKICFNETPFVLTARLQFVDGKLRLDSSWNVSFRAARNGTLVGEAK